VNPTTVHTSSLTTISNQNAISSSAVTSTTESHTEAQTVRPEDFVRIQDGKFVSNNNPFVLKGFNYYPRDYGWRMDKAWDEAKPQVEYELSLADELKCNCLRTTVNYQYSTKNLGCKPGSARPILDMDYVRRIKEFLDLASRHGLKVILSLFEYMCWELFNPTYHQLGIEYLEQLIPPLSNDPRILAWDIINEPDLKAPFSQPNGVENTTSFLAKMSGRIRELDRNHLVTVGIGRSENVSKIEGIEGFTDFISFHDYGDPSTLISRIAGVTKLGKPTVLEEFGAHTYTQDPQWPQSEDWQLTYYVTVLKTIKSMSLSGSLFWTLVDFPVTILPNALGPVYDGKDNREHHFGLYRTDYSPKPARGIVMRYYAQ
jgi:endo-1,4-beta-mannosidase